MSAKKVRELEGLGLIYSAGRSEANYRLLDESAIWCVQAIESLRALAG
jgi:MerR family copper efflux transcriptional regulator